MHVLDFGVGGVCVCVLVLPWHTCRGKNTVLKEFFFSFHLVGSRDEIQFVSLGSSPFTLLNHLVDLLFCYAPVI